MSHAPVFKDLSFFQRYIGSALSVGVALLARYLLSPVLGDDLPYVTLLAAVAFSAWFCGLGPSIMTVVVASLSGRYLFLHPSHSLSIPDRTQSLGILSFLFSSTIIVAFGELSRRNDERLRVTQSDLEDKVRERTIELDSANQNLRNLTGQVLHLQDEERRRIARDLHDSMGQSLVAMAINLAALQKQAATGLEQFTKMANTASDSAALVEEMITNVRTISYLLHPPILDEAGLGPALRWYIQGFAERSKISVDLDIAEDFGRLPRDLETAIFRVVQECLTNIHRHAESQVANVSITKSKSAVGIEVRDEGKGIPAEKLLDIASSGTPGVGIRGMRERLRQLGGSLDVDSKGIGGGTVVTAELPFECTSSKFIAASAAGGFTSP